ncbi:Exosome complex component CSL4 [Armadillidium nasatum]|uniref:Exosome complex component CSL4 n=1 Tax=Armadillidium nasatum TaxID=96803 RepID=A0A5N5T3J1_9CRUS|nr:Exosome complex component CSL4 [Armadillidium nasatum]
MPEGNGHLLCVPGERLCESNETFIGGEGTYTLNGYIFASVAGKVEQDVRDKITLIKVSRGGETSVMPEVGSIITGRVLSVNQLQANISILAVGENMLHTPFQGTLKKVNVRQHEIDRW